jgi:hypothetical protein
MKNTFLIVALALSATSCKTKNESSDLVIISMIPAKASATTGGATSTIGCVFDPANPEVTPAIPYNPAENAGFMAAVVQNNLTGTNALNADLRTDSATFLPHQAVVDYEFVPASAGAAPPEQTIPTSGVVVKSNGGTATVGVEMFRGLTIAAPTGTYVRTTMHLEGKLLDGSIVHTAEREYLFQVCNTAGCGLGGYWSIQVGGIQETCF